MPAARRASSSALPVRRRRSTASAPWMRRSSSRELAAIVLFVRHDLIALVERDELPFAEEVADDDVHAVGAALRLDAGFGAAVAARRGHQALDGEPLDARRRRRRASSARARSRSLLQHLRRRRRTASSARAMCATRSPARWVSSATLLVAAATTSDDDDERDATRASQPTSHALVLAAKHST